VGFISGILGFILIVTQYQSVLILLVGLLLLGLGIYLLDLAINHHKALIKHGEKISGKISGVLLEIFDPQLTRIQPAVANMEIYNLLVKGFDPVSQAEKEFISLNLFQKPEIDFSSSTAMDIYINPSDKDDYYVDVRKINFKKSSFSLSEPGKYKSTDGKNYQKI